MIVNGTFINHQYIEENPELIFEERVCIDEYFEENPGLTVEKLRDVVFSEDDFE